MKTQTAAPRLSKASTVKPRLPPETVIEIFSIRPMRSDDNTFVPPARLCRELSLRYNICDRTIRDIWNRRSWQAITRPHWNQAEIAADPTTRHTLDANVEIAPVKGRAPGQPQGAKDTIPRQRWRSGGSSEDESETASPAPMECVEQASAVDDDSFEHETASHAPQEWQESPDKIEELSMKGFALETEIFSRMDDVIPDTSAFVLVRNGTGLPCVVVASIKQSHWCERLSAPSRPSSQKAAGGASDITHQHNSFARTLLTDNTRLSVGPISIGAARLRASHEEQRTCSCLLTCSEVCRLALLSAISS
eukprot:2007440-Rhodomonas_salina.1